jgi:hypothetical protein
MIAGFKQIIERAHEHGVRIIGATITPFNGSGEKVRQVPFVGNPRERR